MQRNSRPWQGWYKLARWKHPTKGRRAVQLSAHPLCRMCIEAEIVTQADTADHVIPHRGDYDLFWYGELQSLCASCHSKHKQREEHGKAVVRFGQDGWPL